MKTKSRTRRNGGVKILVKPKAKSVQVARKSTVDVLVKKVRALAIAKYGSPQVQRQVYRSVEVGFTTKFRLANDAPVCTCVEAIASGASIYSTSIGTVAPNIGLYDVATIGNWVQQSFPLTLLNAQNSKFDLQLYRNAKSLGVSSTYLVKGVSFDCKITSTNFNGYVEAYIITPSSSVTRVTDQERRLPYIIPGFINMTGGTDAKYSQACQFYKIKRLWRHYINNASATAPSRELQTNAFIYRKMYCNMGKNGKLIRGTDPVSDQVTSQDIPTTKQTWLMFSSSNTHSNPTTHVEIELQRNIYWRDSIGSK